MTTAGTAAPPQAKKRKLGRRLPLARAAAASSGVNRGELLFLALATCYCNDLYREAEKLGIDVREVNVEA